MKLKEQKPQIIQVEKLKLNDGNPRYIKEDNFIKLVNSIKEFPRMLEYRPVIVNEDFLVLAGNMRLRAAKEIGLKEIPVLIADKLTEKEQRELIIKDNVGYGDWDWNMLANEWDKEELISWGIDIPEFEEKDFSDKNKEVDINEFENTMVIKLNYSEEEFMIVKDQLSKIAPTPEQAVWLLLGNEN